MNEVTERTVKDTLDERQIEGDTRKVLEILCEICFFQGEREGLKDGEKISREILLKK